MTPQKRRQFLASVASAGAIAVAGCSDSGGNGDGDGDGNGDGTGLEGREQVEPFELIVFNPDYAPIRFEWYGWIADSWNELGFDVTLNAMSASEVVSQALVNQEYHAFQLSFGALPERLDPDYLLYQALHSSQSDIGGGNWTNYKNPAYDAVAEAQRREPDPERRREHVLEAQEIAMGDQTYTPVVHEPEVHPYNIERWANPVPGVGEGLLSFWNLTQLEPLTDDTTLRVGASSDLPHLNPLSAEGITALRAFRLFYDRLVRLGTDGTPQPWLAEDWEWHDETTIEVRLDDRIGDMTFHDGEDLTVEDVKFSFEFFAEHSQVYGGFVDMIDTIEIVDETTLMFGLDGPHAPFVITGLGLTYIIPEHIWTEVEAEHEEPSEFDNPDPVGSGPYQFEHWRREEEFMVTAFDDHIFPPTADALIRLPYESLSAMVGGLEQDVIDVIGWTLPPDTIDRLAEEDRFELVEVPSHGLQPIHYHDDRRPFDDLVVRQACAHAIPKDQIVEEVYLGRATKAISPIGPANTFWHNPDVPTFDYDMDRARELLSDAGYDWDDDGNIYYPEGERGPRYNSGEVVEMD